MNHTLFVKGTGNFVYRIGTTSAVCLEKSQRCHYKPGTHLPLIFVAQIGIGLPNSVVTLYNGTTPLLREPGFACSVEKKGKVHGLLVALHNGVVPVLVVGGIVTPGFAGLESPFESFYKTIFSYGVYQSGYILRHKVG